MRFLHLSDLHLGKQMNDLSLLAEQRDVLEQIVRIAEEEQVQAVLIAGDIYQTGNPQAEAMTLFDSFVTELSALGLPVLVISGNHDSARRIAYFSSLLTPQGVYMSEPFTGQLQRISLQDEYGELVVWLLPFVRPALVQAYYPQQKIKTSSDALQAILAAAPINPADRNVLVAHQFIIGCEVSDSEEVNVGTLDAVSANLFDVFDYVALGHIHKPQRILRDSLRYAGSPLKYSFSEAGHQKSAVIADVGKKGSVSVRTVPLVPKHDVRLLSGTLVELMQMPYSEDYLWITVHDELVPPDVRQTLCMNYPNMLRFSVANSKTRSDEDIVAAESIENKTVLELFCDFYRLQNGDQHPAQTHLEALRDIIDSLGGDEA